MSGGDDWLFYANDDDEGALDEGTGDAWLDEEEFRAHKGIRFLRFYSKSTVTHPPSPSLLFEMKQHG